ncbi:hypothetical protein F0562_007027 [Nyssa sinensis]|uniref:Disease resistance N-terminal domain-containing protein n=1 Tax=Nyssa sinensis TaxID=561372 RepID=A0A5J5A448_9ASTE|nr:hypothetical protein F0562_007027 [Nyssa sinensis]
MANALLSVVLKSLKSLIEEEIGLLWGVDKEMEKLSSTLSTIQAVLEDAELKQLQDKALQDWLRKLKHAAYAVDDILDECATEAGILKSKGLFKDERTELFPRLHKMHITSCPKLMLPCLPSLEKLSINKRSEVLLSSTSNLSTLISLEVSEDHEAVSLPEKMLQNLTSLESLLISSCPELESLPEQGLQGLRSLRELEIHGCKKLKSLSEGLQHLTALEKLNVFCCPELGSLPAGIQSLTKLHHLYINGCPELARRCEKGKGEDCNSRGQDINGIYRSLIILWRVWKICIF